MSEYTESQMEDHGAPQPSTASASVALQTTPEIAAPATASPKRKEDENQGWLQSVQSLLITVVIAVFVITYAVQAFQIPSQSMEDSLLIGDYLLVDKAHYGPKGHWGWLLPYRPVRRGDVIVFRYPVHPTEHFVKRVIGVPGDRIKLVRRKVFINGKPLVEPYVVFKERSSDPFRDNFPSGSHYSPHVASSWYVQMEKLTEDGELIVPEHSYFVMGDNRDQSLDSRYWGFVPEQNIVGRPLVIYLSVRRSSPDDDDDSAPEQSNGKLSNVWAATTGLVHNIRWHRVLQLIN